MDEVQELPLKLSKSDAINSELPIEYFNGFTIHMGSGDAVIVLKRYDEPFLLLPCSLNVLKTLSVKLAGLSSSYEEGIQQNILTTDEIAERLRITGHEEG